MHQWFSRGKREKRTPKLIVESNSGTVHCAGSCTSSPASPETAKEDTDEDR